MRNALFIAASQVVLFVAVLVVLAKRAPASWFPYALWGGLAVVGALAVRTALRLQRLRTPLNGVARWVDRTAHLDDRLATLCIGPNRLEASRLAPLLLAQSLALAGRWEPQGIVPRVFPRSALVLGASLLTLALTALISPRDPGPDGHHATDSPTPQTPAHLERQDAPSQEVSMIGSGDPSSAEGYQAFAASDAAAGHDPGKGKSAMRAHPNGTLPLEADTIVSALDSQADEPSSGGRGKGADTDLANDLREMMRDLASAEKHRGAKRSANREAERSRLKLAKAPNRTTEKSPSERRDESSAQGDLNRLGRRNDPRTGGREGSGEEQSGVSGGARAARDGGKNGTGGVLGNQVVRQEKGGQAQTFSLRLSAVLSNAPTEFEPQQPRHAPVSGGGGPDPAAAADTEAHAPDDPLHKTEVAPEYEEILRRVFDRR